MSQRVDSTYRMSLPVKVPKTSKCSLIAEHLEHNLTWAFIFNLNISKIIINCSNIFKRNWKLFVFY